MLSRSKVMNCVIISFVNQTIIGIPLNNYLAKVFSSLCVVYFSSPYVKQLFFLILLHNDPKLFFIGQLIWEAMRDALLLKNVLGWPITHRLLYRSLRSSSTSSRTTSTPCSSSIRHSFGFKQSIRLFSIK